MTDISAHGTEAAPVGLEADAPPRLLADRAYASLRDRLVTLAIAPGAPIDEDALGAELGIGRTPVREAIKRLALENLVTVYPRRGTFASEIQITDLADISDVRVQLEGHAAHRAAQRIDDAGRARARELIEELRGARAAGVDRATLMDLDARVHRFVHGAAGNAFLEETLARYLNLSLRIWHLALHRMATLPDHVAEHEALLEAILAGDAPRARETVSEHVAAFAREMRAVL